MAENTRIEWAHHTFNPWIGCQKVSAACDMCYAEALVNRFGWTEWGPHGERVRTAPANWRKPLAWNRKAQAAGERHRVFCASLADVMDNRAPDGAREDLYALIRETPALDWLLLTKRPENFRRFRPSDGWPANVWLGITAEDQPAYYRRWPKLAAEDCRVRFISYEPALGPLDMSRVFVTSVEWPDLVICGGESGPKARPAHPQWFRDIRDQCEAAGVAFHFKQWGEHAPVAKWDDSKGELGEFVEGAGTEMVRVGKKAAGRLLDGREWNGMPA